MPRIAFIAAIEREVAPLVRGWKVREMVVGHHPTIRFFENEDVVVMCGGMGAGAARWATATVIKEFAPARVVSVGYAGALDSTLKVGEVFEPRMVINAKDGSRTDTGSGEKALVSYEYIAGKGQKAKLHKAYGASAVDMEAAAVAQGAQAAGIEFAALKVISDDADSDMPPMGEFVGRWGQFYYSRFVAYVITHPRLWVTTLSLARNSARASRALCTAITDYLKRESITTTA